jgi:hypothetical protein
MPGIRLLAAGFALLVAAPLAPAADRPDLSELRDAVKAAEKRGDNVREVAAALAALDRALAKNFKPGEAPPELTALREAVELAGRKGENVEAIRGELAVVEKVVAGQSYVRPKPPPPPEPPPLPPAGRRGGIVIRGGGNTVIIQGRGGVGVTNLNLGGRDGNSTSITLTGDGFTIRAAQNGVKYTLTGGIGADGLILDKVTIIDGDKKPIEAKAVKDVPEEYRPMVEGLLRRIDVGK